MLVLHVQAPFAAFRAFVAGSYRSTAPFITPSAAYGLLLNAAGIESRFDDGASLMTRIREDGTLPAASLAIGMLAEPQLCILYQQLHNYPVTGKDRPKGLERTKGAKYNIQPVHRELLCGIHGYIAVKDNDQLEQHVKDGLAGGIATSRQDSAPRYGVPFLGDNAYLIDKLAPVELSNLRPARWYCRLQNLPAEEVPRIRPGTCRMTVRIDRADMSQTISDLYAPGEDATPEIPAAAWTWIEYPAKAAARD